MGTPRIIREGAPDATGRLVPAALSLLHKTRIRAAASGSNVTGTTQVFTDSAYAYALISGGNEVVYIYAPARETTTQAITGRLRVLSGAVRDGKLSTQIGGKVVMNSFRPTAACLATDAVLSKAGNGVTFSPDPHLLTKLSSKLRYGSDDAAASQMATLAPSMYSGAMQRVVQFLLGVVDNGRGVAPEVTYDYRWHRTHLIVRSTSKKPFLVEISAARGVLAMRLPVYKSDSEFTILGADKGGNNPAIKDMFTHFGGVPTGADFPVGDDLLASMIEGGTVLQLLTPAAMAEFYEGTITTATPLGWTNGRSGGAAYSTCIRYSARYAGADSYTLKFFIDDSAITGPVTGDAQLVKEYSGELFAGSNAVTAGFGNEMETTGRFWEPLLAEFVPPIISPRYNFPDELAAALASGIDRSGATPVVTIVVDDEPKYIYHIYQGGFFSSATRQFSMSKDSKYSPFPNPYVESGALPHQTRINYNDLNVSLFAEPTPPISGAYMYGPLTAQYVVMPRGLRNECITVEQVLFPRTGADWGWALVIDMDPRPGETFLPVWKFSTDPYDDILKDPVFRTMTTILRWPFDRDPSNAKFVIGEEGFTEYQDFGEPDKNWFFTHDADEKNFAYAMNEVGGDRKLLVDGPLLLGETEGHFYSFIGYTGEGA